MKKLVISALAIYGGIKLGEKLLKKYREPIAEWAGKKVRNAVNRTIGAFLEKSKNEFLDKVHKESNSRPSYRSTFQSSSKSAGKPIVKIYEQPKLGPNGTEKSYGFELAYLNTEEMLCSVKKFDMKLEECGQLSTLDIINSIDPDLYSSIPISALNYGWDESVITRPIIYPICGDQWRVVFPPMIEL